MKTILRFLSVFAPVILVIILGTLVTQLGEPPETLIPTLAPSLTPLPTTRAPDNDTFYDGVFAGCMAVLAAETGVVDNQMALEIERNCKMFTLEVLSRDLYRLFYGASEVTPTITGSDA